MMGINKLLLEKMKQQQDLQDHQSGKLKIPDLPFISKPTQT